MLLVRARPQYWNAGTRGDVLLLVCTTMQSHARRADGYGYEAGMRAMRGSPLRRRIPAHDLSGYAPYAQHTPTPVHTGP